MRWRFIDDKNGQISLLLSSLRLPNYLEPVMEQEAIISEYLRDCIYKLALSGGNGDEENKAVHTRKIGHVLNQQLGAIWPQDNRQQLGSLNKKEIDETPLSTYSIRYKLNNLQLLGDIAHIGNGFWLPTPLRLVQLPNQEDVAIIGGGSTKYAQGLLKQAILQGGLGRLIKEDAISKRLREKSELWQSYEQWIGWSPRNLRAWTEEQLNRAQVEGSGVLSSFENYEVFTSFRSSKSFRSAWIRADEVSSDMLEKIVLLCRTKDKPASYFLGVFQNGKMIKELSIKDKEILAWLRLGLRVLHGKKSAGHWNGEKLRIYPPLPTPLEKHVLLYAYKAKSSKETSYYVINEHRAKVEELLGRYGFVFLKSKGGTAE